MNLALERYAENPVIDELVYLPHKTSRINSVRACASMFRRPFIEVETAAGETLHRHFLRESFARDWAEALVILETLTDIELISDFVFEPVRDREALVEQVLATRDECIAEADLMFEQRMYPQFLNQFGMECKNLPRETRRKIDTARARQAADA